MVIVWTIVDGKATLSWKDEQSHAYGLLAMQISNDGKLLLTATGVCDQQCLELDSGWAARVGAWTKGGPGACKIGNV